MFVSERVQPKPQNSHYSLFVIHYSFERKDTYGAIHRQYRLCLAA